MSPPNRLSVLFFHRVFAQTDALMPGEPTAEGFERLVGWLASQYRLLPLDEAVARLREGTLPAGAAALTFDDGYRDNFEVAAPILQRMGVPATFFVASGYVDGGIMWNDAVAEAVRRSQAPSIALPEAGGKVFPLDDWPSRGRALGGLLDGIKYLSQPERSAAVARIVQAAGVDLPTDLMMTRDQLHRLAAQGFGIGGHTVSHPILARLPDDAARAEIVDGRRQLEDWTGRPVTLFAYPNGRLGRDFGPRHARMAREAGFLAAFTTEHGAAEAGTDVFQLPRFTPWDRHSEHRFRMDLFRNQWRRAPRAPQSVHG